jgi:hypothetical protein
MVRIDYGDAGGYRRSRADTGRIIAALQAILAQCPGERTWPTARHGSRQTREPE